MAPSARKACVVVDRNIFGGGKWLWSFSCNSAVFALDRGDWKKQESGRGRKGKKEPMWTTDGGVLESS